MNDCCIHDSEQFREWNKGEIETKKMNLQLSCDDFKEKIDDDKDIPYENVFVFHKGCCEEPDDACRRCKAKEGYLRSKIKELKEKLCALYDNNYEMWTMYGILFTPVISDSEDEDSENSDESDSEDSEMIKGDFYYDPLCEANSDAEYKFFRENNSFKKHQLVRTGHICIRKSWDEKTMEAIKILAEKKNIYSFYFNEKLRDLIPE